MGLNVRSILGAQGLQASLPFPGQVRRGLDSFFEPHGESAVGIGHKMGHGFIGSAAEFGQPAPAADRVFVGGGI